MSAINQIIENYLDDPEKVSDEEMALLLAALGKNTTLAVEVKDQLMVNELLAQRYGVDRQDFMAQVDQRIRDYKTGEAELAEQVHDLRTIAEQELEHWELRSQRARRRNFVLATALVILVAVGISAYVVISPTLDFAVEIAIAEGGGTIYGPGRKEKIRPGEPIRINRGEQIKTSSNQAMTFEYTDKTRVHVGGESVIEFDVGMQGGKFVKVHQGSVSANVTPQTKSGPMTIETNNADVIVKGTEFFLLVDAEESRLDVIKGSVGFQPRPTGRPITVQGGYYASSADMKLRKSPWPTKRGGLVFLMDTKDEPNFVLDQSLGVYRRCVVEGRVHANWNKDDAMILGRGRFETLGSSLNMLTACRKSNELTLEGYVSPFEANLIEPGHIMTFSSGKDSRNFSLTQKGDQLVLQLKTAQGEDPLSEFVLYRFPDKLPRHIMVSCKPGRLVCYVDGEMKLNQPMDEGDFSNWNDQHLVFGGEYTGGHQWHGTLQGIAIYSRFIEHEEALANAAAYHKLVEARQ